MNQQRKEIVIKEIEYWKKNRLLPEQYCNYLLTLYSEGEHETRERENKIKWKDLLETLQTVFLLFLPVSFLVIYFTELPYSLQMTLKLFLTCVSMLFTFFYMRKNQLYHTFFTVYSFLFLFFITIELVTYFLSDYPFVIEGAVTVHCLLWYLVGKKFKKRYLKITSLVCAVILLVFFINQL
jgi:hypothetical protein